MKSTQKNEVKLQIYESMRKNNLKTDSDFDVYNNLDPTVTQNWSKIDPSPSSVFRNVNSASMGRVKSAITKPQKSGDNNPKQ